MGRKIVVAISGASGSIYARVLLDSLKKLCSNEDKIGIVLSDNAPEVWKHEISDIDLFSYSFNYYDKRDYNAPFASGSAGYDTMIVVPCSMGTLGRIANGVSDSLITRAADVMLKERKKLILVTRETPLNLIHIRNMMQVTEAGGIICPASPSFYSKPENLYDLAATVVNRVLDLAGFEPNGFRWGQ